MTKMLMRMEIQLSASLPLWYYIHIKKTANWTDYKSNSFIYDMPFIMGKQSVVYCGNVVVCNPMAKLRISGRKFTLLI